MDPWAAVATASARASCSIATRRSSASKASSSLCHAVALFASVAAGATALVLKLTRICYHPPRRGRRAAYYPHPHFSPLPKLHLCLFSLPPFHSSVLLHVVLLCCSFVVSVPFVVCIDLVSVCCLTDVRIVSPMKPTTGWWSCSPVIRRGQPPPPTVSLT